VDLPSHPEADLNRVRTIPIATRENRVDATLLARPPAADRSVESLLASLPDLLAARDLRKVIAAIASATGQRAVIVMLGGHVIKTGMGPLLVHLMRRGVITHLALASSASIHDFELCAYGGTSEDVAAGLVDGTFGMAEETGRDMNAAINEGHRRNWGMGEALARWLASDQRRPGLEHSVMVNAWRLGTPVTVHAAIGTDIIHQHPHADGEALGATTFRDFKRLAASVAGLHDGGVVMNLGSAVIMPEVFLKALTVARNLDRGRPTGFTAVDCDMLPHYRPRLNVVERPTMAGGTGIMLTGHHEIMIPLIVWGVDAALDRR
jgi:deoxyhypusine synthase